MRFFICFIGRIFRFWGWRGFIWWDDGWKKERGRSLIVFSPCFELCIFSGKMTDPKRNFCLFRQALARFNFLGWQHIDD